MTACAFFCHGLISFFKIMCLGCVLGEKKKKSGWCVVLFLIFFSLSPTLRVMSLNAACRPDKVECSWWWRGIIGVRYKCVALSLCWEKIMKIVLVSDFGKTKIRNWVFFLPGISRRPFWSLGVFADMRCHKYNISIYFFLHSLYL